MKKKKKFDKITPKTKEDLVAITVIKLSRLAKLSGLKMEELDSKIRELVIRAYQTGIKDGGDILMGRFKLPMGRFKLPKN
jgi:hypothetical protein